MVGIWAVILGSAASAWSSPGATEGLRNEREVLKGVLGRAGGAGGMHSLPDSTLERLCERGVKTVLYLYPSQSFGNAGTHRCNQGSLRYRGGGFTPRSVRPVLEAVAQAIRAGAGPVLVHCWNGSHAAGEASSYALMQFCAWSGERAARYWAQTVVDQENLDRYGAVMNRIRSFRPFPELVPAAAVQSQICP